LIPEAAPGARRNRCDCHKEAEKVLGRVVNELGCVVDINKGMTLSVRRYIMQVDVLVQVDVHDILYMELHVVFIGCNRISNVQG